MAAALFLVARMSIVMLSPRITPVNRTLADPDGNPTNYPGAVRIKVPAGANAHVTAGLARWVENAVLVIDESGHLYQSWGTAIAHNIDTRKPLDSGKTYYVSSWHKAVADKGDSLPWFPSTQKLQQAEGGGRITAYHNDGNGEPDAFIDIVAFR